MTREQIVDYILVSLNSIAKCQCVETCHNKADKYDKEYTYTIFKVNGRKKWKFGIWILDSDDRKSYKVYLFGEHKWFIDKFKPTATEIKFEPFEISKRSKTLPIPFINEDGYKAPDSLWKFGWVIGDVARSGLFSRIKYYWGKSATSESVFDFVFGDWFFYTIKAPLVKWYYNYGMIVPLTISKFLYKLKFGRKVDVNVYSTREYFCPKWGFQIVYNTKDKDEIYDIYHKINKAKRTLFLPKWFYGGCVDVVNTDDVSDHNGFYYFNYK